MFGNISTPVVSFTGKQRVEKNPMDSDRGAPKRGTDSTEGGQQEKRQRVDTDIPEPVKQAFGESDDMYQIWRRKQIISVAKGSLSYLDAYKASEKAATQEEAKEAWDKIALLPKFTVSIRPEHYERNDQFAKYEEDYKREQRNMNAIRVWLELRFIANNWEWRKYADKPLEKISNRFRDFGDELAEKDMQAWVQQVVEPTPLARERRLLVRIDESRQSKDEERQLRWLQHFFNDQLPDLQKLSNGGQDALRFYKHRDKGDVIVSLLSKELYLKRDGFLKDGAGKTFDFHSKHTDTRGLDIDTYCAAKVTGICGGGQKNQCNDLGTFLDCAVAYVSDPNFAKNKYFVAVVDGAKGIEEMQSRLKDKPLASKFVSVISCRLGLNVGIDVDVDAPVSMDVDSTLTAPPSTPATLPAPNNPPPTLLAPPLASLGATTTQPHDPNATQTAMANGMAPIPHQANTHKNHWCVSLRSLMQRFKCWTLL